MTEKKKNVFELLIFAVLMIALILYYGFGKNKDKPHNENSDITVVQTSIPTDTPLTAVESENKANENNQKMPSATMDINSSVSAKSDEYHNETEEGVQ
ncbi:MAG: hypothetical protein HFE51_00060 [Clostridia bacterium]|nr:hypothetical protein [Clostridia bacterium]NDO19212.1 hypothetical protein [Lachnospiraceae bacterium MD329]